MAKVFRNFTFFKQSTLLLFNKNQKLCINRNIRFLSTTHLRRFPNSNSGSKIMGESPITIQEVENRVAKTGRLRRLLTTEGHENIHEKIAQTMGVEKGYKIIPSSREYLYDILPKSQAELEPRSMQDSFCSAIIPLSTDLDMQDKYVSFMGHVRLGRLLEDMDIFAVWVVENHIKIPNQKDQKSPYTLVTALVDKIDFTGLRPKPNEDIRLSGHVSWVGSSSAEVVVWLEQKYFEKWQKITRALFVIAARDPCNRASAPLNPLIPANAEEEKIFSGGLARKKQRLLNKNKSLRKVIPTDIEQRLIHDLFLRTMPTDEVSLTRRVLPKNCLWMENCTLSNIIFSHPENRNLHHKVFGGFIMRQATELSWVLAFLFSKYRPELKHISDINFHKAIDVNSLIRMTAHVVYTEKHFIQISVYAETFDGTSGDVSTTNEFHFTYVIPEVVPEVLPRTYHEAMMYLDGKRHFMEVMEERNNIEDSSLTHKSKL